ncbi:NEDD8-activating enzyme E1 [Entomortierella parvispora]|uniref:NEDD8-activating enzyme E1 catalytic subunit n=1 Tax=Entomortierella parvispora TaxID=205924 RepID=A0A9P3HJR6_9FUNG|nr:NEDD8-activating enzyme E1 [Entomortierella parvispora]
MVDAQSTLTLDDSQRWAGVYKLLDRSSLIHPEFEPVDQIKEFIKEAKILVIGAGGLGCEILKNLALSGFCNIHVIDMDTIDVSNLNRQFLFRRADVGKPKAVTAAAFINKRVQGVTVTPHYCKIQDKDEDFYQEFALVICGLDSIEARRWMNATLFGMFDPENPDTMKPLIDGGTEGFKGQARVILPGNTSCYECSMDMLSKPTGFPLCTIANTPRLPEHCIEWASVLEWPNKHGERKMDTDDPKDIQWLYETALARAKQYNIQGVTYSLTQGVVKNIIPAIASTNAIIAASCCNEALKLASTSAKYLNNYMMYSGNDSVYTYTFEHQRKDDCPVCGNAVSKMEFRGDKTLEEFMDFLKEKPDAQLKKPSFAIAGKPLYLQAPKSLEEALRPNLLKPLKDLVSSGDQITVTDSTLPFSLQVEITLV